MLKSESIIKIIPDLLQAQKEMTVPVKGSTNPFHNSKYADINAVLGSCVGALHNNNICLFQPVVNHDNKNYVQTILIHISGEFIGGEVEIKVKDEKNPQAEGSGITYARRYGLQSLLGLGAEDDDGNKASQPKPNKQTLPDWLPGKFYECLTIEATRNERLNILQEKKKGFIAWAKEKKYNYDEKELESLYLPHIDKINEDGILKEVEHG